MKTADFDYDLDDHFIAQHPREKRDEAKLMLVDRESFDLDHVHFYDLVDHLRPGDLMVINDTRVRPARLYGHREGKEEKIEVLLLKPLKVGLWECLVKPGKKMKLGTKIIFNDQLEGEVCHITEDGSRHIAFHLEGPEEDLEKIFEDIGQMPLPPYIKESLKEKEDYQTVYSHYIGSAAAPTAGLHFTKELLEKIKAKGVEIVPITLHVGLGTFRPVMVDDVKNHHMHSELCMVSEEAADKVNRAKKEGRRVIAVGTTSMRTLESMVEDGRLISGHKWTDIFIYPGFDFQIVDALITNFHLPQSTLLMLVSAFASKDIIFHAYEEAKKHDYRFFSFGDAMFIRKESACSSSKK